MELVEKLKNLLVMAAADGNLTEREIAFLTDRCVRWSLDDHHFSAAVEYALSPDATFVIPKEESDRVEMLTELLHMMAADGELADTEKQLFATAAARMDISGDELNALIDSIL